MSDASGAHSASLRDGPQTTLIMAAKPSRSPQEYLRSNDVSIPRYSKLRRSSGSAGAPIPAVCRA
jgi:hypothetical protein